MTTALYLLQVILYLSAIAAIPVALTKRKVNRKIRLIVALCPILLGLIYYFATNQSSGIFIALMGMWALFFVTIHPNKPPKEED